MNICSIIARNYLAQARVLAESFRRHHPDDRCHVLVIDDVDGVVRDEDFVVIRPEELGVEAFEQMRAAYSVMELSTALKPWLLRHMLEHHDDGSGIAYLDPDIQVFSRMVELEAALREHAVVLTPHVLGAMPRDGHRPNETDILLAGVYNLGFIGMSDRPDAHVMLDWWAERLVTDCYVAPDRGYFVDQRWVDFVPGLIEDLKILRDPGYNVAYWNLPERDLERSDDQYWAGGRPLRFFHFSGYDSTLRTRLSVHQSRVQLAANPLLEEICNGYADALEACGRLECSGLTYAHDTLPSGLRLTALMRAMFRTAVATQVGLPPLFGPDGEAAFLAWLGEPAADVPALNRFLHGVWAERADLRHAFPGVPAGDVAAYVNWLVTGGSEEIGAPAGLIPRVEEPPAAAPAPAPEPSTASWSRPSGVNVVGYVRSEHGVGEVARQMIGALDAGGVTAAVTSVPAPNSRQGHRFHASSRPLNPFPVNLLCINADMLPAFAADVGERFFADRYTIGVWWWETDRFPEIYHRSFELLDEVWVGSRFIADALRRVSPVPVIHMPMPVVFPESAPPRAAEQRSDAFTFLFVWDYCSVFERKNPLAVVEAYTAAFAPDDGAELILKCINHGSDPVNHRRLTDAVAGRPDIVVVDEYLDPAEKNRLMRGCDCYVSLHRSEGLGLTIAEALFYGRPVIATGYSGNMDLMDDTNSHPVGYRLVPIGEDAAPYPPEGTWAEPDVAEASRLMRRIFESPDASAPRAAKGAVDMRLRHSAQAAGAAMRQRLVEIEPRVPAGSSALVEISGTPDVRRLLDRGGRPDRPSRFGKLGAAARRLVLRVMRPYTAYQLQVNEALAQALASMNERADDAAARADLDLAEVHATLSAQIRQLQSELANVPQPEAAPAPDGRRAALAARADRAT